MAYGSTMQAAPLATQTPASTPMNREAPERCRANRWIVVGSAMGVSNGCFSTHIGERFHESSLTLRGYVSSCRASRRSLDRPLAGYRARCWPRAAGLADAAIFAALVARDTGKTTPMLRYLAGYARVGRALRFDI
jgi:hypothetical protein